MVDSPEKPGDGPRSPSEPAGTTESPADRRGGDPARLALALDDLVERAYRPSRKCKGCL